MDNTCIWNVFSCSLVFWIYLAYEQIRKRGHDYITIQKLSKINTEYMRIIPHHFAHVNRGWMHVLLPCDIKVQLFSADKIKIGDVESLHVLDDVKGSPIVKSGRVACTG